MLPERAITPSAWVIWPGVVVAFVDHSLELRRCVIEVRQVVGSVEGEKASTMCQL